MVGITMNIIHNSRVRITTMMLFIGLLTVMVPAQALLPDSFQLEQTKMDVLNISEKVFDIATTPTILAVGMAVGMGSLYYSQAVMAKLKEARKNMKNFLKFGA